jgi:alkanesulfonate monooxygenase SsuD/methylene tetrahydromethanopterin reductase-like flavin-dependent oxidoreductase (luciferase family)
MTVLGAVFRPQVPPEQLKAVALAAEEAGLEELWVWEDSFFESGIAAATAALAWTSTVRVGIGLLPTPFRNVALASMEVATVARLFPGRFLPGIGHGIQDWMAQAGARVASPLTLLREYTEAMHALLRGETVTVSGRYVNLDGVKLEYPPLEPVPVYAGATGPKTLRLSGAVADGSLLEGSTGPASVIAARKMIDEGRAAAGRTDHHRIIVSMTAATGPGARERFRAELASWEHDPDGDLGAYGDAEAVAAGVRRLVGAGADTVICVPTADEPDLEGFIRFIATEVRPLVP